MTKQDIIAELKKTLIENVNDLSHHNLLIEAAEKNKGAINKKILKYLPEGSEFKFEYGMYNIIFPNKKQHLIGWERSTQELTKESIEHSDSCYGKGARERIETLESILNDPAKLNDYCKKYLNLHKAIQNLKEAYEAVDNIELEHHYNPCHYDIVRMMGVKNSKITDLFDDQR